jgi:polysaccharide biosynthesis/export protein
MTANCHSKNIDRLRRFTWALLLPCSLVVASVSLAAQAPKSNAPPVQPNTAPPATMRAPDVVVPGNYVIGTDDVLAIVFWRDKEMTTDSARVRPDGRIALPLLNEIQAAGLTPEDLQKKITEESKKYMEDASVTVVVKEINSLKVFITGQVNKPGPYPLTSATSVIQLISLAGGLTEYANTKNILIMRKDADKQVSLKFNYKEVSSGKNLKQNIELKPGDTVIVP